MGETTKIDRMRKRASDVYEAALKLPRPGCYRWQGEWEYCVKQMVEDLCMLSFNDGCISAAWAMSMIETAGCEWPQP